MIEKPMSSESVSVIGNIHQKPPSPRLSQMNITGRSITAPRSVIIMNDSFSRRID